MLFISANFLIMTTKKVLLPLKTQFIQSYRLLHETGLRALATSSSNSGSPQPIFIEKEEPVIVVSENDDIDIIGPPHSVSNLRPIIRKKLLSETELQRQLREMQNATQSWNQEFWTAHNTNFFKERQEYLKQKQVEGEEKYEPTAEEMSEFYKSFLDKNWERHLKYNFEWYKKNFILLMLAFRVGLEKNISRLR